MQDPAGSAYEAKLVLGYS